VLVISGRAAGFAEAVKGRPAASGETHRITSASPTSSADPPPRRRAHGYRGRMPTRPSGPQHGLFDNPVRAYSLEELTETVQALERQRPGRAVDELTSAVFTELAMKRTMRAADLVAESIRIARSRHPRAEITGSRWQAATSEVMEWAADNGFQIGADGTIPEQAITSYNQTHPDRPY
jgi:hypothetical protein